MIKTAKQHTCDFCGKRKDEVNKLVVGDGVAICDECVTLCQTILNDHGTATAEPETISDKKYIDPKKLKAHLDQYIIGQDDAKIGLSVGVTQHYKRMTNTSSDIVLDKTNILLMGPSGSGKTALVRHIAEYLDVPFAICDATGLTESGYVGADPESILASLVANADGDIERAQYGIIYIDEIDKISKKSESASITRDVSGEGVQQALLKIVEGTIASVSLTERRKHPNKDTVSIDTSNILFIVGGAFVGLDKIIARRKENTSIGFGGSVDKKQQTTSYFKECSTKDLIAFGLIPEFVGRFGIMTHVNELSVDDLVRILSEPKHSIVHQYKHMFRIDGLVLEFTKDALRAIATKAKELETNARGLKQILEKILIKYQFEAIELKKSGVEQVLITEETVNGGEASLSYHQ